jgi:predicted alpha/beta hydrolase
VTHATAADALTVVGSIRRRRKGQLRVGVLVVPALGVPARRYAELGDQLASRGVPAGLYEIRGQGQRPRATPADDYGYTELADEIGPAIEAFRARAGVDRVVLMGHSLGGQLSLIHAVLVEPHDVVFIASGLPYWRDYPAP